MEAKCLFELQPDIDTLVNKAFESYEMEKVNKRLMKKTINHIVFKSDDGKAAYTSWGNIGIQTMVASYPEKVKEQIIKMTAKYPGWKLLNTNIPAELLN